MVYYTQKLRKELIPMKKYIILDTETTNDIECPIVYDFGFSVIDESGKAYASYSFVNADVFCDDELMATAYLRIRFRSIGTILRAENVF
jgi:hypothetical protein